MAKAGQSVKKSKRLQSAMEYLSTYGWAILIIAIVFFAMFELGVFNSLSLAPKVVAGGCVVNRPNGPGSVTGISMSGTCTDGLPKYAAQFNGQNSYISIGNPTTLQLQYFTAVAWVYIPATTGFVFSHAPIGSSGWGLDAGNGEDFDNAWVVSVSSTSVPIYGSWHQVGIFRFSNNTAGLILDGEFVGATTYSSTFGFGNFYIGDRGGAYGTSGNPPGNYPAPFNGLMSNVQIYNTALSANDIYAMYLEGIGGEPINIRNLVAWWPLDGDTNDYSGNNYDGVGNNVTFSTNWYSTYTTP